MGDRKADGVLRSEVPSFKQLLICVTARHGQSQYWDCTRRFFSPVGKHGRKSLKKLESIFRFTCLRCQVGNCLIGSLWSSNMGAFQIETNFSKTSSPNATLDTFSNLSSFRREPRYRPNRFVSATFQLHRNPSCDGLACIRDSNDLPVALIRHCSLFFVSFFGP